MMGVLHHQMVICITYDYESNDRSKLDDLVSSHPHLFSKSGQLINSTVNYVMFWDGSKEGWDLSDEGDELREEFIKICKQLQFADIYEISDHEAGNSKLKHTNVYNPQSLESTAKRDENE